MRQLDKVYATLISLSKETKHNTSLVLNLYYVTIKHLKWPSIFLLQNVSSSQAMEKAFSRTLDNMATNFELSFDVVSTDRHLSVDVVSTDRHLSVDVVSTDRHLSVDAISTDCHLSIKNWCRQTVDSSTSITSSIPGILPKDCWKQWCKQLQRKINLVFIIMN